MTNYYFTPDDKLNRFQYARFLENIILHHDHYKRNDGTSSYVIALNASWGSGKSYFLSMLSHYLEGEKQKGHVNKTRLNKIRVVNYNAWENDFWGNAFEPLMYSILESDLFDHPTAKTNLLNAGKKLTKAIKSINLGLVTVDVQTLTESASDFGNVLSGEIDLFPEYKEYKKNLIFFKEKLSEFADSIGHDRQLVIVIDELDRCTPTFAIQTLEIIKHIFDVDNIVFLFAIDVDQLSCSVKAIYGQDFDATGYLCRFFDYMSQIPNPDKNPYLSQLLSFRSLQLIERYDRKFKQNLVLYFMDLQYTFDLSLRDNETIIQSYKIMCNMFLKKYYNINAHYLYIFFLALKYKQPQLFRKIFIQGDVSQCINDISKNHPKIFETLNKYACLKSASNMLAISDTLGNYIFMVFCQGTTEPLKVSDVDINANIVNFRITDNLFKSLELDDKNMSCNDVIFIEDLMRWDEIKKITFREHLHKQLEMFNFVNLKQQKAEG